MGRFQGTTAMRTERQVCPFNNGIRIVYSSMHSKVLGVSHFTKACGEKWGKMTLRRVLVLRIE